jgi:putative Mg2+ transporter-C (MgtC) family protein
MTVTGSEGLRRLVFGSLASALLIGVRLGPGTVLGFGLLGVLVGDGSGRIRDRGSLLAVGVCISHTPGATRHRTALNTGNWWVDSGWMHVHEVDLLWRLGVALGLSSVIGIEREIRQKSAGLRTYALVGTGAALFMLVSQYGFADVIGSHSTLDPSRVAAQIVTGIGFIGGGLIFVRRDAVRGLTTAAGVWTTAAIGMAAGGDLPLLAGATTAIYLLVCAAYPVVERALPRSRFSPTLVQLTYRDGRGLLRDLLGRFSEHGFSVSDVAVERTSDGERNGDRTVTVQLEVRGRGSLASLTTDLNEIDGVLQVSTDQGQP